MSFVSHLDDETCQHVADGTGRCDRPALWQVFVSNGSRSYFACDIHLTKISQAMHDDNARRVTGGCMNLKRLKDRYS
jgi:hypothetical protein